MPRQQGTVVTNNFIQGLITEATALRFPENACTEADNCVFDETGRITRRLGFDLEDGYSFADITSDETTVFTEYLWQGVAGNGSRSFHVQQAGRYLTFYDTNNTNTLSGGSAGLTIDLASHKPSTTPYTATSSPCQYASGTGRLIVVSRAINPLLIEYLPDTVEFQVTELSLTVRDFIGLADGLAENERITSTVADLIANNPKHYYNILNQGWFAGDALSQWDTARTDAPSNRDYPALYRSSATDIFEDDLVTANTPGSRPASKGHFILSAWCPDYESALDAEGFSAGLGQTSSEIPLNALATISDFDFESAPSSVAFDGNIGGTLAAMDNSGRTPAVGYIGKTFSSGTKIDRVVVYGSSFDGFVLPNSPSVTIDLYGKTGAAPASSTDGSLLGSLTFTDQDNETIGRVIESSDTTTAWDHFWVRLATTQNDSNIVVSEIKLFTPVDAPEGPALDSFFCTYERPQCVEFFAGRAWYAGIDFNRLATNIYFSQIIRKSDQFDKCYQVNDPASEDFTDLLPDDGGVIVIPEIAKVIKLFAYQSTLIVVATNGVWIITGGSQGGFTATDFVVRKISNEGSNSPLSFLSYRGVPAWWGNNGIYTIQFDANYQSFSVQSLTDQKIKRFFASIPVPNRAYVKGAFDGNDSVGYWLYNDTTDLALADNYVYTKALVINGLSGAFYPWSIGNGEDLPRIRGINYIVSPSNTTNPVIKYVTTVGDLGTESVSFSGIKSELYADWFSWVDSLGFPDDAVDYESYFITGYALPGQAMRFAQPNYIMVYREYESNSSCFVQGIFDFTNTPDSGRWSTPQQCMAGPSSQKDINHSRLKIRGKGRSIQFKFYSESGKPFTIIGWSIWVTSNAAL